MNENPYETTPSLASEPLAVDQSAACASKKGSWRWWIAVAVTLALSVVFFLVPVPLVVTTPGPTLNLNEPLDGHELMTMSGTDPRTGKPLVVDEPSKGQLRMVTISEYGGPGHTVTLSDVLTLLSDGVSQVNLYSDLYGDDVTAEQMQSASQAMMDSSHMTAANAAMEELGWDLPATVTVVDAVPGTHAVGKVQEGDQILSVTTPDHLEHQVDQAGTIFALMTQQPPNTDLAVKILRKGQEETVTITSVESPDGEGSKLGIFLDIDIEMPVDVEFALGDIGGPSAGMMFALAMIDRLTEGDLTGGKTIAGTGAMSYDGRVEPIGGLPQKMVGAQRDGADFFLAPAQNCDAITSVPDGLKVFRVSTLSEARAAVHAIANGQEDTLKPCLVPRSAN